MAECGLWLSNILWFSTCPMYKGDTSFFSGYMKCPTIMMKILTFFQGFSHGLGAHGFPLLDYVFHIEVWEEQSIPMLNVCAVCLRF